MNLKKRGSYLEWSDITLEQAREDKDMKMKYTNPEIDITLFATEAIICDSGTNNNGTSNNGNANPAF